MSYRHATKAATARLLIYAICLGLQKGDATDVYRAAVARLRQLDQSGHFAWRDVRTSAVDVWTQTRLPQRWDWRLFYQRLSDGPLNALIVLLVAWISADLLLYGAGFGQPTAVGIGVAVGFGAVSLRAAFRFRRFVRYSEDHEYRDHWRSPSARLITSANLVSLSRLFLVFWAWEALSNGQAGWAFGIVAAVVLTDVLDGYIARRFDQVTRLGAILDPAMNRISCGSLLGLALFYGEFGVGVFLLLLAVIVREILVFSSGMLLLATRAELPPVSKLGKISGVATWLAILLVFGFPSAQPNVLFPVCALAAVLSSASAIGYKRASSFERLGPSLTETDGAYFNPYTLDGVLNKLESNPLNTTLVRVFESAIAGAPGESDPMRMVCLARDRLTFRRSTELAEELRANLDQIAGIIDLMRTDDS